MSSAAISLTLKWPPPCEYIQLYALWEKLGFFLVIISDWRSIVAHVRSSCRRLGRWTVPRSGTRSRDSACLNAKSADHQATVCTPHQWINSSYKLSRLGLKRNASFDFGDYVNFFATKKPKFLWENIFENSSNFFCSKFQKRSKTKLSAPVRNVSCHNRNIKKFREHAKDFFLPLHISRF